jgi:hypothetical protein
LNPSAWCLQTRVIERPAVIVVVGGSRCRFKLGLENRRRRTIMSVERQILESTGWALWSDLSQIVYIGAGIVGILALAANSWLIPLRAERAAAMAESELKAQPVFTWSRRLLLEDKWEPVGDGGELTFFIKHPIQKLDETRTTSVVVKEGETTLSWISIVALASNNVWPIGADQELEDGKNGNHP